MTNSKIQWCDHTFNPWIGCTKVSAGCANCYAEADMDRRRGRVKWGKGQARSRTSADYWMQPLKWNRKAASASDQRPVVFCASLADWLDDDVPIQWLADLLHLIHDTQFLGWLLLTKRPENWRTRIEGVASIASNESWLINWYNGKAPINVWVGASVEDQKRADDRIPSLVQIPAKVRFLSVEPMLGSIDLQQTCFNGADSFGSMPGIHWVIFGGESGPNARPCNISWIRDGVRQCRSAGVAPFVKQLGKFSILEEGGMRKRVLWDDPKGGNPDEWPEDLRVREIPI